MVRVTRVPKKKIQEETSIIHKHGDFTPIIGSTGATVYALLKEADYLDSMRELDKADLEAVRYQEILPLLIKDDEIRRALWDETFCLADNGANMDGVYTVDIDGELTNEPGSKEISVSVVNGKHPPLLYVNSDRHLASNNVSRFCMYSNHDPKNKHSIIVGVPKKSVVLRNCDFVESENAKWLGETKSLIRFADEELSKILKRKAEIKDMRKKIDEEEAMLNKKEGGLKEAKTKAEQIDESETLSASKKKEIRNLLRFM